MGRKLEQKKTTHNTGKQMIGWWTGEKECKCNNPNCVRHGGAACVRRANRIKGD